MAQFKEAVLTRKGIALLAKAQAEEKTISFTRAVTGNGTYEDGEDISQRTELKSYQQEFAPTTIARQNETNVYVRFSITNNPSYGALQHGYYVTEIGLMAMDPDDGEILYGIAIAEEDKADYLPAYNNLLPAVIGVDFLIEVDNAEEVIITTDLSAYATNADLNAKGDRIAFDGKTNTLFLKANGVEISRCVISFDDVDLSSYVKKTELAKTLADYAKTEDLDPYAKTEDLAPYAKTEDLAPYAKTEDLGVFALKTELEDYAKTEDLQGFATTGDLTTGLQTKADHVSFDKNTKTLSLLSGETQIDSALIEIESGDTGSLATEQEVQELGEELIHDAGGTVDDNARVAEEDEVEDAIENLDNI